MKMNLHTMSILTEALKLPSAYFNKMSIVQESKLVLLINSAVPPELERMLNIEAEDIEASMRLIDAGMGLGTEVPESYLQRLLALHNIVLTRGVRETLFLALSRNPSTKLLNLKVFLALLNYWKNRTKSSQHLAPPQGLTIHTLVDAFPDILRTIDVHHSIIKLEDRKDVKLIDFLKLIRCSALTDSQTEYLSLLRYLDMKTNTIFLSKLAGDLNALLHPPSKSYIIPAEIPHQDRLTMRSTGWYNKLFNIKDKIIKELNVASSNENISKQSLKTILQSLGSILSYEDFDSLWSVLKECEASFVPHNSNDYELRKASIRHFFEKHQPVLDNSALSPIMGTNERCVVRGAPNYSSSIAGTIFQLPKEDKRGVVASTSTPSTDVSSYYGIESPSSLSRRSYISEMNGLSRENSVQNVIDGIGVEDSKIVLANNLRFAQSNQKYHNFTNNEHGVSSLLNQANIAQLHIQEAKQLITNPGKAVEATPGKRTLDISAQNENKTSTNVRRNIKFRFSELKLSLSLEKLVSDLQFLQKRNGNILSRYAIQEALLMNGIKLTPPISGGMWSELCEFSKPDSPSIKKLFNWIELDCPASLFQIPESINNQPKQSSATPTEPNDINTSIAATVNSSSQSNSKNASLYDLSGNQAVSNSTQPNYSTPLRPMAGEISTPHLSDASSAISKDSIAPKTSSQHLSSSFPNIDNKSINIDDVIRLGVREKFALSKAIKGDRLKLLALTSQLRSRLRQKLSRGDTYSYEASPDTCSINEFKGLLESFDVFLTPGECKYISEKVEEFNSANSVSNSNLVIDSANAINLMRIGDLVLILSNIIR